MPAVAVQSASNVQNDSVSDQASTQNTSAAPVTGTVVQAGSIHNISVGSPNTQVRPAQLPPDVSYFTGRVEELAKLDALLHEGGTAEPSGPAVVISAIAGAGGMGKTSVAVHWAHQVRDRFPDGQLYVNLRGYDPSPPLTPAQALDGFLRAMGMTGDTIPHDLDSMTACYRSLLADRRVLVVLDNAVTAEQIRPLLPGTPTCFVVVTSRSRLSGLVARNGAHRITLDQLAPSEAVSLLRQIVGPERIDAEPDATRDLARRCAYLPLALRIAADRVADRPHQAIADLATTLADEQQRLDILEAEDDEATAVRAVFSWSYQALPTDTARVFRLLGLHAGRTISIPAAAALAGTSTYQARRHLHMLRAGHLLTEIGSEHFQLHDLIRDYAAELVTCDPELTSATRRILNWYLHTASAASDLLYPHHGVVIALDSVTDVEPLAFSTRDDALNWYEVEHGNLFAVVQYAADHGHHDIAARLPTNFDVYLILRARWADQITVHQIALTSAYHLRDPQLEVIGLAGLCDAYMQAGRLDECVDTCQRLLRRARELGDRGQEAGALHTLGNALRVQGNLDKAAGHYLSALPIYQEIGKRRGEALMLGSLGEVRRQQRRFDEARDYLGESLDILRRTNNRWNEALCLRWMGRTCADQSQHDDAIACFRHSVTIYREVDDHHEIPATLQELGDTLHRAGELNQARNAWLEALTLFEEIHAPQVADLRARLSNHWKVGHLE
ncbi:tetratricopeptide repeat protein [Saccharopolyspora sp. NPDC049426]|uniref:ATP-binding protein n=1 Tax=Saccharopolyspora sp. NPDC049426 TaxID=3155652 RepID=UPI003433E7C5